MLLDIKCTWTPEFRLSVMMSPGGRGYVTDEYLPSFWSLQIVNEYDVSDADAVEMSVEELQKWTDDELSATIQVRHKGLQSPIFA